MRDQDASYVEQTLQVSSDCRGQLEAPRHRLPCLLRRESHGGNLRNGRFRTEFCPSQLLRSL